MTAVTDEFPYYLRPKKAVFSGLICVAMYLMGLVLTTDVSGFAGQVAGRQGWEDTYSNVRGQDVHSPSHPFPWPLWGGGPRPPQTLSPKGQLGL